MRSASSGAPPGGPAGGRRGAADQAATPGHAAAPARLRPRSTPRRAPPRAAASTTQTVVERRAADLIVIGASAAAALAAYSVTKAGRRVILLPDFGLAAPAPPPAALQPLKVTHPSGLLTHLSVEAAAYWRGLELLSDSKLVQPAASLDFVFDPAADTAGAAAFASLAPAAAAAGARAALLSAAEVRERLAGAPLRLPDSASALLLPDAGVLLAREAAGAARALAERAGVLYKERLKLRGWRDAGGAYFRVEASSDLLPDSVSVFESERLLLAPDCGQWAPECLQLFGLQSDLEVREVVSGGWLAGSDATKLPLWQFWGSAAGPAAPAGAGSARGARDGGGALSAAGAGPLRPCFGLPMLPGGARAGLAQPSWLGREACGGAFGWAARGARDARGAAAALEAAAEACVRDLALEPAPGEEEEGDGEEGGAGGPADSGAGAAAKPGGGGGAGGRRVRRRVRAHLVTAAADGLPAVGCHPGYEPGRLLVCVPAAGGREGVGGCLPPFQLAPVLAKLAADLVLGKTAPPPAAAAAGEEEEEAEAAARAAARHGAGTAGAAGGAASAAPGGGGGGDAGGGGLAAALRASRPAVALRAAWPGGAAGVDTSSALSALQRPRAASAEELERAADEASDRRRDEKGDGRGPGDGVRGLP